PQRMGLRYEFLQPHGAEQGFVVAVGASHAVFASRDQGGYIVTDRSRYFNGLLTQIKPVPHHNFARGVRSRRHSVNHLLSAHNFRMLRNDFVEQNFLNIANLLGEMDHEVLDRRARQRFGRMFRPAPRAFARCPNESARVFRRPHSLRE
ncbi:hypothetical protein, partial [Burkholderia gladioli]|uniref:hypothetical protein n=1 Tax=Burkholderia gladioli TaxID=28095 RepID=UPI001ABA7AB8